jgi:hypothetical protein
MKKITTTGIIVGGIIASLLTGMTAGAQGQGAIAHIFTYFGTDELAYRNHSFLIGYTAGVSDTLHYLAAVTDDGSVTVPEYISRSAQCLDTDSQSLGVLTDWAVRKWQQSGRYNAASVMMAQACNP